MRRILIRAGLSPLENLPPVQLLRSNSIGNNVGNLIYAYSMFRALMTEHTNIIPNHYKLDVGKAEQLNEEYDCFVIPLADAFRKEFMPELRKMTEVIKKLNIPCVVTGVGLRAPFEPELNKTFVFDEEVKEFIKAVLDKSAMVGVRGEITSSYLTGLGFREGIDHTVIGCPSMYMFGADLTVRDLTLSRESTVSINNSVMSTNQVQKFLNRSMEQLPNHYFVPQRLEELRLLYTGMPYSHTQKVKDYPCSLDARLYAEDRVKFFNSAPTWLDFLRTVDFSIGARLHGNIAAVLAGTPALLLPHDARMRELTEYHNLVHVWAKDITGRTNILDLAEKLDFKQVLNGHDKRFEHFVGFLEKNGLEHIYQNGQNPAQSPLDRKIAELDLHEPVNSIRNVSIDEMTERFGAYFPHYDKLLAKTKQRAANAENNLAAFKRTGQELETAGSMQESEADVSFYRKLRQVASRVKNKWC